VERLHRGVRDGRSTTSSRMKQDCWTPMHVHTAKQDAISAIERRANDPKRRNSPKRSKPGRQWFVGILSLLSTRRISSVQFFPGVHSGVMHEMTGGKIPDAQWLERALGAQPGEPNHRPKPSQAVTTGSSCARQYIILIRSKRSGFRSSRRQSSRVAEGCLGGLAAPCVVACALVPRGA
jgi:hypothetical protein